MPTYVPCTCHFISQGSDLALNVTCRNHFLTMAAFLDKFRDAVTYVNLQKKDATEADDGVLWGQQMLALLSNLKQPLSNEQGVAMITEILQNDEIQCLVGEEGNHSKEESSVKIGYWFD